MNKNYLNMNENNSKNSQFFDDIDRNKELLWMSMNNRIQYTNMKSIQIILWIHIFILNRYY